MRRFFLAVFCALALSLSALAADAALPSLEAAVNVREDGVCEVTMTAEVDFSAAQDSLLIPLGTDARDITLAGWSYETVLQDGVTCLKLSNPAGFSGKQQFTCSYTLPCRAAEAADGQQFRLSLPETGWDYAIDSYSLTMTFPAQVTNAPEWTSGYYGDVVDNYLDIRTQENTVTAKSTAAMRDHETLTVAVQFPADTFNLRDQPGKTAGFDRIAFLVLLAAAVAFWFLRLRSGLILPRAQQTIGMESTAGEIPCQLLGEAPDAAGMIVHWGNLGYLTVRMSRGRAILYKRMEMGNERKPSERRFFAALFRAGASCEAGGLRYQAAVREMQAPILTGWRRRMFTGGNPLVLCRFWCSSCCASTIVVIVVCRSCCSFCCICLSRYRCYINFACLLNSNLASLFVGLLTYFDFSSQSSFTSFFTFNYYAFSFFLAKRNNFFALLIERPCCLLNFFLRCYFNCFFLTNSYGYFLRKRRLFSCCLRRSVWCDSCQTESHNYSH